MKRLLVLVLALLLLAAGTVASLAEGDDDLILSNCDSTIFWSANSQGMDALESDSVNLTEGTGSVGATAINGKLNQIAYIPDEAMDISNYAYLEFDVYFSDITWFSDCGAVMFELTSSGTCDQESNRYMKKVIRSLLENGVIEGKENWWHFVLELDNPQGKANGALNKANFNYFRFYTVDPISTTPDYVIRLDNMRFTNHPSNYTPQEEETTTEAGGETTQAIYVVQRDDPNAGIADSVRTIILIEAIVLGVLFLGLVAGVVIYIVKRKKGRAVKKAGGLDHE